MLKPNHYGDFFHKSYTECRSTFLNSIKELRLNYNPVIHKALKVASQSDDDLFIDTVHLKTSNENKNLAIIASGVHGIEGFTGSALQNILIEQLINDKKKFNGFDFLFIHAVNPWGFKNKRRVNENNVDLNRNFGTSKDLFAIQNQSYATLNQTLNPTKKLKRNVFTQSVFTTKMLMKTIFKSKRFIVEAVGVGQYQFDKGIIFGGYDFQPEKQALDSILKETIEKYQNIYSIDLHSGLGKKGDLYILDAPLSNSHTKQLTKKLYNNSTVAENDEDFYNEHGSFLDYISSLCRNGKRSIPVMFEFGTINTHTLLGGAKILTNLKDENQGYHYGYKTEKDSDRVKKAFKEMLNPPCKKWQAQVAHLFLEHLLLLIENSNKIQLN